MKNLYAYAWNLFSFISKTKTDVNLIHHLLTYYAVTFYSSVLYVLASFPIPWRSLIMTGFRCHVGSEEGRGRGTQEGGRIQSVPLTERRAVNIPAAATDHSEATRPGSFIFSEVGWSKIITIDTVLSTSCGLGYTIVVIPVLKISVQLGFDNNCVCPLSCGLLTLHSGRRTNGRRHYKVPRNAPPQPSLNPASHKTQDTGSDHTFWWSFLCHIWGHKEEVIPVAVLLFMITLSRIVTLPLDPMGARYSQHRER